MNIDKVYHYTSYRALLSMVNDQKGKIIFWASRYDCMNDPTDCMFARGTVMRTITKYWCKEHEKEDIRDYTTDAFPYVISFSGKGDDKFMWKHYGSQVCLVLNSNVIKNNVDSKTGLNLARWGKCYYVEDGDDIQEVMNASYAIYRFMDKSNDDLMNFQETCSFIKRAAYQRESEWRLVLNDYNAMFFHSANDVKEEEYSDPNTKFRCSDKGEIIPYKEFPLPGDSLLGIIVNESNPQRYSMIKKHIELLLNKNNFSNYFVKQSNRYPL